MFDGTTLRRVIGRMLQNRQVHEDRIEQALEQRAAIQRLRQREVERLLAEDSKGYLELGDRSEHGPDY